jgi:hypothetical protein
VTTAHIKPFSRTPTPCTPSILIPILRLTSDLQLDYLYSLEAIHIKHLILYCCEDIFTAPLSSNGSIRCRGNVFSDPFPSDGHNADHIENTSFNHFSIVACAYFGRCVEVGLDVTI